MIGQSAGKSFAYLVGVYLGDGCVTRPSSRSASWRLCFKLNTIDEDFALATKAALECLGDFPVSICKHDVKGGRPNHSLYCGNDVLCTRLRVVTNGKQKLPEYILEASREEKLAFIVGLMDSEGFVGEMKNNPTNRRYYMGFKSTDCWVPDFVRLLESVGIRTGKVSTEVPRKPHYRTPMRFHVKMQSWVDSGARFNIARKQSRVDTWASRGAYEMRAAYPRRLSSETNTQAAWEGDDRVRSRGEIFVRLSGDTGPPRKR